MSSRIKKSHAQFDQVLKIEQEYAQLASVPFKIIDHFEKKILPGYDFNFSGILHINEFGLDQNNPQRPVKPQAPKVENSQPVRSQSFLSQPTAPPQTNKPHSQSSNNITMQAEALQVQLNDPESLLKWQEASRTKPTSESTISNAPTMMTTHENLLFCMDASSYLSIYERAFTAELKNKNSLKLGVPNPKSIAANESYVAVSYSGLKKEQMKGTFKKLQPNGVIIYRRENFVVCTIYDKAIELKDGEVFKNPCGIAMTSKHLLVCDRELKSVFKFDIKSGALVQRARLPEGEPYSISINANKIAITDCSHSSLVTLDLETFAQLKTINLKQIDQVNGHFQGVLTDEDLLFVKNSENQLSLFDGNLQPRAYFNDVHSKIQNIAFIKQNNQMLIIGCTNSKQQYKLFGYIV